MDRNENPGINPGNGPATWQEGGKPHQPHASPASAPQEFISAMPSNREGGSEGAGAGPLGSTPSSGTTAGPGNVSGPSGNLESGR